MTLNNKTCILQFIKNSTEKQLTAGYKNEGKVGQGGGGLNVGRKGEFWVVRLAGFDPG